MPGCAWATDVLRFWLEDTAPEKWFQKDDVVDAAVGARFAGTHAYLTGLSRDDCLTDPQTALAAVIVLDQFSRNMFRGSARAFAFDAQAVRFTREGIERGFDGALSEAQLEFFYVPLMHSESLSDHGSFWEFRVFNALGRKFDTFCNACFSGKYLTQLAG